MFLFLWLSLIRPVHVLVMISEAGWSGPAEQEGGVVLSNVGSLKQVDVHVMLHVLDVG